MRKVREDLNLVFLAFDKERWGKMPADKKEEFLDWWEKTLTDPLEDKTAGFLSVSGGCRLMAALLCRPLFVLIAEVAEELFRHPRFATQRGAELEREGGVDARKDVPDFGLV